MRRRSGFALLAAIWLCVAIAAVALQFSLDARERRLLGINTAERGRGRAAAVGALNSTQAALESSLRQGPGQRNALRGSDPWLDADSLFTGVLLVDSIPVEVDAYDLGKQLNINEMNENQLRTFFSFALKDFSAADHISQSILDWRDADSIPRPNGLERDGYIREGRLTLPANQPFRELTEMLDVDGMTPEIFEIIKPHLKTRGGSQVNVNTADTLVLRALPGMTDPVMMRILAMRSGGQRIQNLNQIFGGARVQAARGGGGGGIGPVPATERQLRERLVVDVTELQVVLTARVGPQQLPVRLNAIIERQNNNSRITWKQW